MVSELLLKTLYFYSSRGEKLVIEGIHFSKEFLKYCITLGAKCILLDNQNSWSKRVQLKMLTTPVTRVYDPVSGIESYCDKPEYLSSSNLSYLRDEKHFKLLHNLILSDCLTLPIKQIKFMDLNEALHSIYDYLDPFYM
jgi:hypothetical protein